MMPVGELRVGMQTSAERWKSLGFKSVSYETENYLQPLFETKTGDENIFVNGGLIVDEVQSIQISSLKTGEGITVDGEVVAANLSEKQFNPKLVKKTTELIGGKLLLKQCADIFRLNADAMHVDFQIKTKNRTSARLDSSVTHKGELVFIEEGAKLTACTLNSTTGPIYIDKDAEIMEGSMVRGPFYLGEHAALKMGTKIYGATTVGPHAKVGGEVNNSVIWGYSNKGHDGFLGNSVLGKWCNLGADTNNSNLKNNYGEIKVWDYSLEDYRNTGMQFCGLIMGDHSKTGINTMLNTGTVVGFAANIFGGGFPPKFIPSFSWGGAEGFTTFKLEKAFEVAERMMSRRGINLTEADKTAIETVYELTKKFR